MAKLGTFLIATLAGAVLGIVGVVAAVGALNPSADHVANETSTDAKPEVYGTR